MKQGSIKKLFAPRCGAFMVDGSRQDRGEVTAHASAGLDANIHHYVLTRDEIAQTIEDQYPCLCGVKYRSHNAVLNGLPEMPLSSQ